MRVTAVVQARMGSSRLPGKIMVRLGGRPVLAWVLRALDAAEEIDEVMIATSRQPADDEIENFGTEREVRVVRGSELDVLSRFGRALEESPADAVVRITADCPLIDPALVDQVVSMWRYNPEWEYVSTTLVRSLPRGLDVELISATALRYLERTATDHHRRHVTSGIYTQPEGHLLLGLTMLPKADDLRVTLDTEADLKLLTAVIDDLGDRVIPWYELVRYLRSRPDVVALNAGVEQKALEEG